MSPELIEIYQNKALEIYQNKALEIYQNKALEINFNPEKSDLFSLGISFLRIIL